MSDRPRLRRLVDLPGVADLEFKALMKPRMGEIDARPEFPEIGEACAGIFGLSPDEADDIPDPEGWDNIDARPAAQQVLAFEDAGWDVTDNKRRPLRLLPHFSRPLWLAIRGVAGALPFQADDSEERLKGSLAAEAARFRRDRR